jgi:hypothetical protein
VAQEQGDGDQPWELAGGHTGGGADESIEFVSDVKFVEECRDEAARPLETAGAIGEFLQNVDAMVLSPVLDPDALRRPRAWLWVRDSSAGRFVAHGRHLRQSACSGSEGGHLARRSVARGREWTWRDASVRGDVVWCRGLSPTANDQV